MKPAKEKKIRLVEVRVQPLFMIDDGENLVPLQHDVISIPAEKWKEFATKEFYDDIAKEEEKLNAISD